MKLWPFSRKSLSIDQVIARFEAINMPASGVAVTPENCMRSPTVHAIVTAVSRRISVSPLRVMQKTTQNGHDAKLPLPKHPVSVLLNNPNDFQTKVDFWLDGASELIRYGNMFALKQAGNSGPVRRLIPLSAGTTKADLTTDYRKVYKGSDANGTSRDWRAEQVFHARGGARDFITGDSPVHDVREAIGLEIAAEQYGATFFGNGAVPLLVFQMMQGFKDFENDEDKNKFLASIKEKLGGSQRHKAFLLPKGIELADAAKTASENNKAQFIESRKHQRTVIAGAFGVPPHLVGDLERATFNNVEQQDSDFTINVVLPYVRGLEAALELSFLTAEEREKGIIIRFNLDAIQRADFKSRQEGLQIQRLNGIINANQWREMENMNPVSDEDGGNDYWAPANYTLPVSERTEPEGDPDAAPIPDSPTKPEGTEIPPD